MFASSTFRISLFSDAAKRRREGSQTWNVWFIKWKKNRALKVRSLLGASSTRYVKSNLDPDVARLVTFCLPQPRQLLLRFAVVTPRKIRARQKRFCLAHAPPTSN
jgi:hypothetical protein